MNRNGNQDRSGQGLARQSSGMGMFPEMNSFFSDFFDVDRFFPAMHASPVLQQMRQQPAVNIIENDNEYRIEVSAPGMRKDDFQIDMEENRLTISAERKYEHEEGDKPAKNPAKEKNQEKQAGSVANNERYTRREFGYSQFSRSFMLPETVDADNIKARYQDGVLCLTLPKREEEKKKKERKKIDIGS